MYVPIVSLTILYPNSNKSSTFYVFTAVLSCIRTHLLFNRAIKCVASDQLKRSLWQVLPRKHAKLNAPGTRKLWNSFPLDSPPTTARRHECGVACECGWISLLLRTRKTVNSQSDCKSQAFNSVSFSGGGVKAEDHLSNLSLGALCTPQNDMPAVCGENCGFAASRHSAPLLINICTALKLSSICH